MYVWYIYISANQSHTSYVLRGYLFWGVKLTYTINHQEGSLVAGAGAGSGSQEQEPGAGAGTKHRNQEPEPREPDPDLLLFLNTNPSGLVFQQLLADGAEVAPCCTVGLYFSDYWLRQRKLLPQQTP